MSLLKIDRGTGSPLLVLDFFDNGRVLAFTSIGNAKLYYTLHARSVVPTDMLLIGRTSDFSDGIFPRTYRIVLPSGTIAGLLDPNPIWQQFAALSVSSRVISGNVPRWPYLPMHDITIGCATDLAILRMLL